MPSDTLSSKEIRYIMNSGTSHSFVGLKFFTSDARENFARFAVLVPKKYIKKATQRNYLKRIARVVLRRQLRESSIYDLVCLITSSEVRLGYISLKLKDIYDR